MEKLIKLVQEYQGSKQLRRKLRIADELTLAVAPDVDRYIRSRYRGNNVEDIVQETLFAMTKGLTRFRGEADRDFMNWCFGIARHKEADEVRDLKPGRRVSLSDEEIWRAVEASAVEEPISADERMDFENVIRLVAIVKPPCDEFLRNRKMGMHYAEIGRKHGISADAARQAVNRCMELARKLLGE